MKLAQDTLVLVADSEKALFLRNTGAAGQIELEVEQAKELAAAPAQDQNSGMATQVQARSEGSRSAVQESDWHQIARERFARDLADLLYKRAIKGDFKSLVLVAAPALLGELRPALHKEVTSRVTGELAKDLTNHPIGDIASHLNSAG
ncbi:host attachment family protein [Blastomonas sp.]|uniref:host attachment family protein n=1 Tax=Blastomonas sp. TaxID=1909299 RepID=UPI0035944B38